MEEHSIFLEIILPLTGVISIIILKLEVAAVPFTGEEDMVP